MIGNWIPPVAVFLSPYAHQDTFLYNGPFICAARPLIPHPTPKFIAGLGVVRLIQALNVFLIKFCAENNLFHFTPHLLRHLHGSYLLKNGLDIAKVSKSLGHAKKSFTLDTYIHTLESVEEETANVMQDVLTALRNKKTKKGQAK